MYDKLEKILGDILTELKAGDKHIAIELIKNNKNTLNELSVDGVENRISDIYEKLYYQYNQERSEVQLIEFTYYLLDKVEGMRIVDMADNSIMRINSIITRKYD